MTDRPVPGAALFEADREGFSLRVKEGGGTFALQGEDALAGLADYVRRPRAVPAFRPDDGTGLASPM